MQQLSETCTVVEFKIQDALWDEKTEKKTEIPQGITPAECMYL